MRMIMVVIPVPYAESVDPISFGQLTAGYCKTKKNMKRWFNRQADNANEDASKEKHLRKQASWESAGNLSSEIVDTQKTI